MVNNSVNNERRSWSSIRLIQLKVNLKLFREKVGLNPKQVAIIDGTIFKVSVHKDLGPGHRSWLRFLQEIISPTLVGAFNLRIARNQPDQARRAAVLGKFWEFDSKKMGRWWGLPTKINWQPTIGRSKPRIAKFCFEKCHSNIQNELSWMTRVTFSIKTSFRWFTSPFWYISFTSFNILTHLDPWL